MHIEMRYQISGTRNGEEWPAPGVPFDLPDEEAAALVAQGLARKSEIETDPPEPIVPVDPAAETVGISDPSEGTGDAGDPETQDAAAVVSATPEPPAGDSIDVPALAVGQLLEWVGDDEARAAAALEVENASSQPRKSAVEQLEKILGDHS